ncbi:MAG: hybrid sensor histidine kinase/response regulator [Anaerolineae bacterium]|nr:hybrid sensor histidine kinase/response regulator [Anaerolineae bacterium]
MHILYIEDDDGLLYLLSRTLEGAGFKVTGAPDGEQGLRMLREQDFDVVLVDQEMPRMTGIEVISQMKDLERQPPIIMVTGAGNEEVAVQAMRMGASDYLVKDTSLVYLNILPAVIRQVVHERELIEAHQATERQLQLERERSRLLSEFIKDASHEFRTPLTIIKTSLHLLAGLCTQPKQTQYLDQIQEQSDSIGRLVSQLLTIARLDNATEVNARPVSLKNLIHRVIDSKHSVIEAHSTQIDLDLPIEDVVIPGDEDMLSDAFTQLLDNAVRYSGQDAHIQIELRRTNRIAVIGITDHGIGIAEEHRGHIFERFFRVDDAHSTPGFGLGLPIAARVIELHQGEISLESAPGKGTSVTVIVPTYGDS